MKHRGFKAGNVGFFLFQPQCSYFLSSCHLPGLSPGFGRMKEILVPKRVSWRRFAGKNLLRDDSKYSECLVVFQGSVYGRLSVCVCVGAPAQHAPLVNERIRLNPLRSFESSLPGGFICMILDLSEHLGRI